MEDSTDKDQSGKFLPPTFPGHIDCAVTMNMAVLYLNAEDDILEAVWGNMTDLYLLEAGEG